MAVRPAPDRTPVQADTERFPFIYGAHYYRAPTPEPDCWEMDFAQMTALGFTDTKFFVQWRWSHRAPDHCDFSDLDALMALAERHGIGVTLNLLLDVSPLWLFTSHPDAKQVDIRGHLLEPYAVGHRTIGGHPGPCYSHPGAREDRQWFVRATIEHFRDHPALRMWDVWNEPELSFPQRTPDLSTLACYCPHCHQGFTHWLVKKYGDIDRLNATWGRWYDDWAQVEMPRGTGGVTDFIDWREFHLDNLAQEAAWRLALVESLDPSHGRYLHVVPNTWFNAVTCVDDFAMAEHCEVFAATMNGGPSPCVHILSAAGGKPCYNVESHINYGSADLHQRVVDLPMLLADLLPQVGLGIKGFLFWQYRAETLGLEAPAWGLVRPDGTPRPVTNAARDFRAALRPHAASLRDAFPAPAEIGIWRSRKNEIFHFCAQGSVADHNAGIDACIEALYWMGYACRVISGEMLAAGRLDGLKLLIMPSPYYLTGEEAKSLDRWVRGGGILLCEAHLGGYDGTRGRHSRRMPGCGLDEAWGLHETESTAVRHLSRGSGQADDAAGLSDDVRKALAAFGAGGERFFPIRCLDGNVLPGAHRYAELAGDNLEPLGAVPGSPPCLARKRVGRGMVYYCGTSVGLAASMHPTGLPYLLRQGLESAGVSPIARLSAEVPDSLHVDLLFGPDGLARFAVAMHRGNRDQQIAFDRFERWEGIFTGTVWECGSAAPIVVPPAFTEIFLIHVRNR